VTDIDLETLLRAIRFGHCSAVHAATLREAGGTWALDALRANEMLFAEVDRLRAIEVAAMDIAQVTEERDDPWVCVPITARQWDALKAALAAKETP
jgi:hypothetical protein